MNSTVSPAGSKPRSIRRPGDAHDGAFVLFKFQRFRPGTDGPHSNGPVLPGCCQTPTIGREANADDLFVAVMKRMYFGSGRQVPDSDGSSLIPAGDELMVGRN